MLAVVNAFVSCAEVTEDGESMTYCELACCHVVSSRCVERDNSVLCAGLNVDVVDTGTCSADSLEAVCVI